MVRTGVAGLYFLAVMICALAACSVIKDLSTGILLDPRQQSKNEAFTIYTALLAEYYPDQRPYVIDRMTRPYMGDMAYTLDHDLLEGLQPETARNFESKDASPLDLTEIFSADQHGYVLVDPQDFYVENAGEIPEQCGWTLTRCFDVERFRSTYPNSQGYLQFSNIGYNTNRTQALAAVELQDGSGSGTVYLVLLSFRGGEWQIQNFYELFWTA